MKTKIALIVTFFFTLIAMSQSTQVNYIKSVRYKVRTVNGTTITTGGTVTDADKVVDISYFDGLGRPVQQVAHRQSTTGKDIITHIEYDTYGRQALSFLPYVNQSPSLDFKGDARQATLQYYGTPVPTATGNPSQEPTTYPFSESFFEPSPLNVVTQQSAPGNAWRNQRIKTVHKTNAASEVRKFIFTVTSPSVNSDKYEVTSLSTNGYYDASQLYKTIIYDENWQSDDEHTTQEFKDKQGRVIMKRTYGESDTTTSWHETYYLYDDFGNLTYVIPPLTDVTDGVSTNELAGLCYQYIYDRQNRLVEKKLPGKQWEYIVYDKLDRIVATGPSFSPFSDLLSTGWLISKYDVFGRPILTAWKAVEQTIDSNARKELQIDYNSDTVISESRSAAMTTINGIAVKYTTVAKPTSGYHILTANYYDDYGFISGGSPNLSATVEAQAVYYNNTTNKPKGMPTGGMVRILENSTSYRSETTYLLYDNKARQIRSKGGGYLGGYMTYDKKFDFRGTVTQQLTMHKRVAADTEINVREFFTFSDQDRLIVHRHRTAVTGQTQLMAGNAYDELGNLVRKYVGGTSVSGTTGYQKIDFTYNIRGWLTNINKIDDNPDTNDLFSFKINYNSVDGNGPAQELYNGNISQTFWKGQGGITRRYDYQYDALNRLTDATYQKMDVNYIKDDYGEHLSYDKNGNIKTLTRNGQDDSGLEHPIDNLAYNYNPDAANELRAVADGSIESAGFKDGTNSGDDFSYDANGNMMTDLNKGITLITYNHLNLPVQITFGSAGNITYTYDGTGKKRRKTVTEGSVITNTEYIDGFQYKNNELDHFPTPEGYVKNIIVSGANTYNYVYTFRDHLGNARLSYAKQLGSTVLEVLEEDHYYPFGLKHKNYNAAKQTYGKVTDQLAIVACVDCPNKYKYNGKELQDELGLNLYDYGARNYDPALGRWMNIDPLAEISRRWSPYNYCYNNPVYFVDPDGMKVDKAIYGDHIKSMDDFARGGSDGADDASGNQDDPPTKRRYGGMVIQDFKTMLIDLFSDNEGIQDEAQDRAINSIPGVTYLKLDAKERSGEKLTSQEQFTKILDLISLGTSIWGISGSSLLSQPVNFSSKVVAKESSSILLNTLRQLQAKFKHAGDFGIAGNYSKANAIKFSSAINQHINSGVRIINGTYRGQSVIHYVNPNTGLNVISSPTGQFISGWKLNPTQLQNVLKHGGL